jgi:DNA-cytosine methyltransferase
MLRSLDLFSGIGGFALALRDVAKPVAYCDWDTQVQVALARLMKDGRLPSAPVVDDVRNLAQITKVAKRVDIVTAGFPCVGFSMIGAREGLQNAQSGLFGATMKVVQAVKPGMVFLENVPGILTANDGKDFKHVLVSLKAHGYDDVRWTTVSAADLGGPQIRNRWFCLAIKKCPATVTMRPLPFGSWATSAPKPACKEIPGFDVRLGMLGNAIVPLAARTAFARLLSGFRVQYIDPKKRTTVTFGPVLDPGSGRKLADGAVVDGKIVSVARLSVPPRKSLRIVLDPKHYVTDATPSSLITTKRVTSKVNKSLWPTPRHGNTGNCNVLTERSMDDLPTVAVFASSVGGKPLRKTGPGDKINPAFVEWLMGYPKGHTK